MEKIAIIEIGSSELKLTLANVLENGYYVATDEIIDVVKLGEDLSKDGFLKANRINETMEILRGYKKLCDANSVSSIDCITTHAIRVSKNQKSFIDEVATVIGFKVRILEDEQQLQILYSGVINTLEVAKGVIIQISGHTTEVVGYIRRNVFFKKILPYGYTNLAEKFIDTAAQQESAYKLMKKLFADLKELKELEPEFQIVGVGSIFDAIGKISRLAKKYPYDKNHNYVMGLKDINGVYDFLKGLDLDKKQKIRGISEDRADYISVGAAIAKAAFEEIATENLVISSTGLVDGILFNRSEPLTLEKPITDILGHSLETQGKYYVESMKNAENVYNLSMILFKQLRVLHKLSRSYVKVLRVASYMHSSGLRISQRDNTKNSYAVVLNANLYGVSHREQILAAFVSASQNAVDFNLAEFAKYRDILTQEDLDSVKKLSVIVRIANSLDRCGTGVVKDITCDILGDSVIIKAINEADAVFEIREAMQSAIDFKKAYKKNLEIL